MANKGIRYENLFGGIKTVKSIDGEGCPWTIGQKVYNLFSNEITPGVRFSVNQKLLKTYELAHMNDVLTRTYYAVCEYKSVERPDKATVQNTMKAVKSLYTALGAWDANKTFVYAEEFNLVLNCVAIQASSKSVVATGGNRCKFTALATFKTSFWNAYYNAVSGKALVDFTDSEKVRKEKFEKNLKSKGAKVVLVKVDDSAKVA